MPARSFRKSQDGVAAVEFALILPVMLLIFFGVVESSMALMCRADVSIMASTAADLISQESTTTKSDLSNVYAAAGTVLYPYYTGGSTGKPTIRLTSVVYDSGSSDPTKIGKIGWTCTQTGSGTLPALPTNPSFAQALLAPGGSVLMAEIAYSYSSPNALVLPIAINMTNNFYTKPRRVAELLAPTGGCP